jgi:hypothetical protein
MGPAKPADARIEMPFNVKRRGKVTYYYEGDRQLPSAPVTEEQPDGGDLFADQLPNTGLPARFTVHVVDVPDQAASYEFYAAALLQRSRHD